MRVAIYLYANNLLKANDTGAARSTRGNGRFTSGRTSITENIAVSQIPITKIKRKSRWAVVWRFVSKIESKIRAVPATTALMIASIEKSFSRLRMSGGSLSQ